MRLRCKFYTDVSQRDFTDWLDREGYEYGYDGPFAVVVATEEAYAGDVQREAEDLGADCNQLH